MFFQESSCSIERGQNQPIRVNFFEFITRLFVSVGKNKVIRYHIIAKITQRPANESICSGRLYILFVALYLQIQTSSSTHFVPQAVSFYGIHHARVIISVASCQCTVLAIIIKFRASATFKSSILFPTKSVLMFAWKIIVQDMCTHKTCMQILEVQCLDSP